jgi:hypothetical protein
MAVIAAVKHARNSKNDVVFFIIGILSAIACGCVDL